MSEQEDRQAKSVCPSPNKVTTTRSRTISADNARDLEVILADFAALSLRLVFPVVVSRNQVFSSVFCCSVL